MRSLQKALSARRGAPERTPRQPVGRGLPSQRRRRLACRNERRSSRPGQGCLCRRPSGQALVERSHRPVRRDRRLDRLVFARDDEAPVVGVVEIDIELGDNRWPRRRVDASRAPYLIMPKIGALNTSAASQIASAIFGVARGHAIKRAVRLDVVERHALGFEERLERADLVDQTVGELIASDLHLPPPEPLRSGSDGCAPTLTPCFLASCTVVRM